jgi:hypothetical protein
MKVATMPSIAVETEYLIKTLAERIALLNLEQLREVQSLIDRLEKSARVMRQVDPHDPYQPLKRSGGMEIVEEAEKVLTRSTDPT